MKIEAPAYVRNAIRTPDGTVLCSRHRHDYQSHLDANGETYMTDGGLDYLRRSVNVAPYEDLSVSSEAPFGRQREAFEWGSYGKNRDQPVRFVKVSEMTDDHLKAVIEHIRIGAEREARAKKEYWEKTYPDSPVRQSFEAQLPWTFSLFEKEVEFRAAHGIVIAEPA